MQLKIRWYIVWHFFIAQTRSMEGMSLDVVYPWIYDSMAIGNILHPTQSSAIRNQTYISTNSGSLILMLFFFLFLYFSLLLPLPPLSVYVYLMMLLPIFISDLCLVESFPADKDPQIETFWELIVPLLVLYLAQ